MKREELKEYNVVCIDDIPAEVRDEAIDGCTNFFAVDVVDAKDVMDEYEKCIKELEDKVIGYKASLERANFKMCEKDARISELEAENNTLKADIEVLNDDCRIAKENEVKYHKAYLNELDENARLKAMKWISVDDVKPQWGIKVKVKFKDGSEDEVRFSHDYKWVSKGMATCESSEVTHWMPLPPPPTEESSATDKENKK